MRAITSRFLVVSLGLGLLAMGPAACGKGGGSNAPGEPQMTQEEARAFVDELRAENRMLGEGTPVESMAEVVKVVKADDTWRYANAAKFAEGHEGPDALALRAILDLTLCEGRRIAAGIFDELARRNKAAADRLGDEGEDKARKDGLLEQRETYLKAKVALRTLSDPALESGRDLAKEALRRYPQDPNSHQAMALVHLLDMNWGRFDDEMNQLGTAGVESAMVSYLQGTEALVRYGDRAKARAKFTEALQQDPEVVRAQARLVLVQDDIADMFAEFEKLRTLAPRHFVEIIAGPAIQREYTTSMEIRGAEANTAPPADAAPAEAAAEPAAAPAADAAAPAAEATPQPAADPAPEPK